jgi:hypothetical protein
MLPQADVRAISDSNPLCQAELPTAQDPSCRAFGVIPDSLVAPTKGVVDHEPRHWEFRGNGSVVE